MAHVTVSTQYVPLLNPVPVRLPAAVTPVVLALPQQPTGLAGVWQVPAAVAGYVQVHVWRGSAKADGPLGVLYDRVTALRVQQQRCVDGVLTFTGVDATRQYFLVVLDDRGVYAATVLDQPEVITMGP